MPAPPRFVEGWRLGTPDLVIDIGQTFTVPAGKDLYRDFVVPTNFSEGTWIRAAEVLPGNRKLVHHAHVYVIEEGTPSAEPDTKRPPNGGKAGRICRYTGRIVASPR